MVVLSVTSIGPFSTSVVVDRGDHFRLVAVGEARRQLEFAEQLFLDGQRFGGLAGQRVGGDPLGQQPPRGGLLGQDKGNGRLAVLVGDDGRIPVGGFGGGQQGRALGGDAAASR